MTSDQQPVPTTNTSKASMKRVIFQSLSSLIILGCAGALAFYFLKTPPKAKPRTRTPVVPLVAAASIQPQDINYEFEAMGTVVSAREIQLTPRVQGEITALSPEMIPGGYVKTGDHLISIDPTDYELTILQLQSDLAKVSSEFKLEMGSQRIAMKEFEILGQEVTDIEKELMLRKPQLGIARAAIANAEARLQQAKIDLSRTEVTAPFNGVVLSKSVDLGSHVSSTTPIAHLVGTDTFWVKVSLPISRLQWLKIPESRSDVGSPARIFLHTDEKNSNYRDGRVLRLAADLETEGRMAVLYVSVEDPFSLTPLNSKKPKLLLGSFVRVKFTGKELRNVYAVDRDHLHENDTLWLLTKDNTLEIRNVDIIARTKEQVYIGASAKNLSLITSQIPSPSDGTPLQLLEKRKTETPQEEKGVE